MTKQYYIANKNKMDDFNNYDMFFLILLIGIIIVYLYFYNFY